MLNVWSKRWEGGIAGGAGAKDSKAVNPRAAPQDQLKRFEPQESGRSVQRDAAYPPVRAGAVVKELPVSSKEIAEKEAREREAADKEKDKEPKPDSKMGGQVRPPGACLKGWHILLPSQQPHLDLETLVAVSNCRCNRSRCNEGELYRWVPALVERCRTHDGCRSVLSYCVTRTFKPVA